jgi:hypothetical protein
VAGLAVAGGDRDPTRQADHIFAGAAPGASCSRSPRWSPGTRCRSPAGVSTVCRRATPRPSRPLRRGNATRRRHPRTGCGFASQDTPLLGSVAGLSSRLRTQTPDQRGRPTPEERSIRLTPYSIEVAPGRHDRDERRSRCMPTGADGGGACRDAILPGCSLPRDQFEVL